MDVNGGGFRMAEETFILLGLFTLLGWIFWLFFRSRQRALQQKIDFQAELLARFESPQELKEFLESRGGRVFFGRGMALVPLSRIMTAVQVGVLLTTLGGGVLALGRFGANTEVYIPGVLLLSGGIGFLLAAFFSYWFSKRHGLLDSAVNVINDESNRS